MSNQQKNEDLLKIVSQMETLEKHYDMIDKSLFEIVELAATFTDEPRNFNEALTKFRGVVADAFQKKRNHLAVTHFTMLYGAKNDNNEA